MHNARLENRKPQTIYTNGSPSARVHLAALLFLVVSLCCCQGGTQRNAGDTDSTTLRVGVLPTQECLRLFYARHFGITDSMRIRLVQFQSIADIDTALMGGSVDVALTDTARLHHLLADSATLHHWQAIGMRLDTLCSAHDSLWLVASDSSHVRGAGGLKDKLVGMLRYSDAQTATNRLIRHAQYEEGDVFFVQVGDVTMRYKMLTARLIDAAFLPHPYADAAVAMGHRRIKLVPTDTLCQGIWVAQHGLAQRGKDVAPLLRLLHDTTPMQPDTLRIILGNVYKLPAPDLDSLETHRHGKTE